jgi:hypothetical protein
VAQKPGGRSRRLSGRSLAVSLLLWSGRRTPPAYELNAQAARVTVRRDAHDGLRRARQTFGVRGRRPDTLTRRRILLHTLPATAFVMTITGAIVVAIYAAHVAQVCEQWPAAPAIYRAWLV